MAGTMGQTLVVQGLAQLQRDLYKANREARTEVREGLKDVGRIVSTEAKQLAATRLTPRTGDLVRKIVPTVRAQGVFVEAKAKHRGYAYPRKFEFGGRSSRRAFLVPALQNKQDEVYRSMERWVDSFLSENNL